MTLRIAKKIITGCSPLWMRSRFVYRARRRYRRWLIRGPIFTLASGWQPPFTSGNPLRQDIKP